MKAMTRPDGRGPVLLLIPVWTTGGAQISLARLASVLVARGIETHLFTFEDLGDGPTNLPVPLQDLRLGGSPFPTGKLVRFRERIHRLRSLKRTLRITTAISYLDGANFVSLLSRQGERVIISIRGSQLHDSTIRGPGGFLRRRVLMPFLYPKADGVVALNEGIRAELTQHHRVPPHRIHVIRNYFDVPRVRDLARLSVPEGMERVFQQPVLCFVGRLAPEKGIPGLMHVFDTVKQTESELKLALVGDGPEATSLRTLADRLGLTHWTRGGPGEPDSADVLFLGIQKNPFPFLARSRALLLNSTSEGGPNVLGEAAVLGVPILSARIPYGPIELLDPDGQGAGLMPVLKDDRRGVLLPRLGDLPERRDLESWREAIHSVLMASEGINHMTERARVYFEGMDISRMGDAWEPLIR